MTKQVIGLGTTANDHAGDSLRVAGTKINSNFTELYDAIAALDSAGNLGFPITTVNLHNGGNQTGQVLQFNNPDHQVIITGPTPATDASAQRLIIQGQRATGTGEGGDVYFWGGDSQINGGDIKIYAGDADSTTEGYGGYVNISGGQGYNEGGDVSITAGYGTVNGGSLSLSAGSGGTSSGSVFLNTGNKSWTLANDGSLQLPPDGTIKDNSGNILISSSTFVDLPNWLTAVAGTNHLPTINSDYGWDSNGVWFTNATIDSGEEGFSYPIRLSDSIPANQGVVITVDFDADPTSNDFGIGVWETGTNPVWDWGPASGNINIGAQYDGTTPVLKAIAGTGVDGEGRYNLPTAGTYRARLTISPPNGNDEITVTLETLDLSNTVLDTISYVEPKFNTSYSIGFAADQDNGTDKTYMKNLSVNINNGGTTYNDTLLSYNSVGTTGTGHFSFADNIVTITGQDMRFVTARDGWDIDCDFDVNAADDVFIEALGDDVGITAANAVTITTSALNMYPNTYYGQEEDFLGTWDGTSLTLYVPNGNTTLITLLTEYVSVSNPIWLKTASGYTKTDTNGNATKTVDTMTVFEMTLSATSPVANADIINMKVYDSINNGTDHTFAFTKNGKLQFPNGGMIEPVGMGWMGITNGTTGNPVSVMAKNSTGIVRSGFNAYNGGTSGNAVIYTSNAPGTPNTGTYTAGNSTGSWDANPVINLGTTGGSGNGLTVDVYQSGSGYAEFVTVVNPGSGYVDGETITVISGSSSATFVIEVQEYNHEWNFTEDGATQLPGSIKGRVQGNTYTDTTIQLDITATINKLTPISGLAQHYHLIDGVEGQIMYIALATGGEMNAEDTCMSFDHARWSNGFGNLTETTDVSAWMPFRNSSGGSTILTLAFIDGHWNLPHNFFD